MTNIPLTMKPFDYYDLSRITQPNMKDYVTTYFYDKGELIATVPPGTVVDAILNSKDIKLSSTAVKQQVLNKEAYEAAMKQYKDEISRIGKELGEDLFKEFNIEDHPKRNRCFSLAYSFGGQYGPQGIYDCFEKLVTLIKD